MNLQDVISQISSPWAESPGSLLNRVCRVVPPKGFRLLDPKAAEAWSKLTCRVKAIQYGSNESEEPMAKLVNAGEIPLSPWGYVDVPISWIQPVT